MSVRRYLLIALALATGISCLPSLAAAESFKFNLESSPSTLQGKMHGAPDVMSFDTGTFSCEKGTGVGTVVGTEVTSISLAPSYSGCQAFGFFSIPIDMNGCKYVYTTVTKSGGSFVGTKDIVCPAGQLIVITAPGCTIKIGSQTGLGTVKLTNIGAGATREITIDENLTGVQYTEHRPLFYFCTNNTVPQVDGTLVGATLITATSEGPHRGIFVG